MSQVYKKIAIIGKHYHTEVSETIEGLYHQLIELNFDITIEVDSADDLSIENIKTMSLKEIATSCDVAIIVGGDGNFLRASRVLALYGDIPVVGVNRGKLGFLTTINPYEDNLNNELIKILRGENSYENISMLTYQVDEDIKISKEGSVALNEIAITASRGLMFGLKVYIDGRYAFDQRGDGLIISTPTGSTAHAMSAGGPILNPNQNSFVLVPICSHSLNSRPLVISDESVIDIYITEYNNPEPVISIDGRHDTILKANQKITIKKAEQKVKVLHPKDYNYYDTLREKLGWSKVLF
ncbi:NAD(+)/NADH kinase [Francisellaceae bacterium CB299]|jgi:NAD+ kinase